MTDDVHLVDVLPTWLVMVVAWTLERVYLGDVLVTVQLGDGCKRCAKWVQTWCNRYQWSDTPLDQPVYR